MATKLPPPPTHMKPGSPAFTEWFRALSDYIGQLSIGANFVAGQSVQPIAACCLPFKVEATLSQISLEEVDKRIYVFAFYLGTWRDNQADSYRYRLKLKRNGVIKRTVRGGVNRAEWYGDDRYVHGIHYHVSDGKADALWTLTAELTDQTGLGFIEINGAGLFAQVR
jgi:hypothetical protein